MGVPICVLTSLACAYSILACSQLKQLRRLLKISREENELLNSERKNERQGRIRAEKKLRERATETSEGVIAYPLKPIGFLKSCFSQRNGTPRQPLLVTQSKSSLTLRNELSSDFLEGLDQFSHCWLLYMFHSNTDFQKVWEPSYEGIKGKIRVPRLNGAKLGIYSTRSPHRPCPIGLSVVRIVSIVGKTVTFAGADIVDGSPILDIKPYVPFCDHVNGAKAPEWVDSKIDEDPLKSLKVVITERAMGDLRFCWNDIYDTLYNRVEDFVSFIEEALSRDFRSVTQRIKVPEREKKGLVQSALHDHQADTGKWHVILHGIDICYDITEDNRAIVHSCERVS